MVKRKTVKRSSPIKLGSIELKILLLVGRGTGQQLIEDVEVPLTLHQIKHGLEGTFMEFFWKKAWNLLLLHDTNLFKEVVANFSAHRVSTEAELDLKVLSKST